MRRRPLVMLVLIALWAAVAQPGVSADAPSRGDRPAHTKLDRFLQHLDRASAPTDPVRVIVTAREGAREHVKAALARSSGRLIEDHAIINAVTVEVPAGRLHTLAVRDDVLAVSTDAVVQAAKHLAAERVRVSDTSTAADPWR